MTTHRLNTKKLIRDVDRARRADIVHGFLPLDLFVRCSRCGQLEKAEPIVEISYRQVAREIGVHASVFTRLGNGLRPEADALCSLLMWLDPDAKLSDYTLDRRLPQAELAGSPATTLAMS